VAGPATRINVRRLAPGDAWAAARVLAASLAGDPAMQNVVGDPGRHVQLLRRHLGALADDTEQHGIGYLARIRGIPVGAALWTEPGSPPAADRHPRRGRSWGRRSRRLARVEEALEWEAASEDGWYLRAHGVDPRHQRRGIGARLLAPILEAADSHGVTCALHTANPESRAFYERFGFVAVDPLHPVIPGGPAYLRMRRHPQ
jgi:GNAT superfamily N-acetyltransferase